jgi:hypothetical protein
MLFAVKPVRRQILLPATVQKRLAANYGMKFSQPFR